MKNNKFFNLVLTCLLLTLPFERLLTFEIFGFTLKISYFFGVLLILIVLPSLLKNRRFQLDLIEKMVGFFVLFSLASNIWSIDHKRTLVISLLYLFVFFIMLVIKRFADTKKKETYLNILLGMGVLLSVFALWQFFSNSFNILSQFSFLRAEYTKGVFPFPRVQATFLEPLFFANFLAIPFFLCLRKILQGGKHIYYLAFFAITVAFILTLSRGAYLALILALLIFFFCFLIVLKQKIVKILPAIFTLVAAIVFSIALIYLSTGQNGIRSYINQATKATDVENPSTVSSLDYLRTRNYTTEVALNHIKQNTLGIGTGAFGSLPEFRALRAQGHYQMVNNEYLEVLVENGIIGFVLLVLFLIFLVLRLSKQIIFSKDLTSLLFLSVLIAWLVQFFTFSNLYLIYAWVFIGMMLVRQKGKQAL